MKQHLQSVSGYGRDSSAARLEVHAALQVFEKRSWSAYQEHVRQLIPTRASLPQNDYLNARIVPLLARIGVDEDFCRLLFGLASQAWQTLASEADSVVHLDPNLQRDIAEVRQGLLIQAEKKMALRAGPVFFTPQEAYDQLQATMDPANLHQLIEEITTPWIVLPRAYASLQRDHVHYLPAYLELIAAETSEEALHIFSRIAIEFLANYTIRFADAIYPREAVVCLVMAAYRAHFWKNLRVPPRGFEDVRIFEHFLNWQKHSGCRTRTSGHDLEATIAEMETWEDIIFPAESDLLQGTAPVPDLSRFVVALRHGCKGIDCAVRYFWVTPSGKGWPQGASARWERIIFALKSLFDLFTTAYLQESRRSRYYIREFLFQLQNTYSHSVVYNTTLSKQNRADLHRLRSKVRDLILHLQHTLATLDNK